MRLEWINPEAMVRPAAGGLSRRSFIKAGAVAGSGLVLGFFMPGANKFAHAADAPKPTYAPNAFLRIAPDNTVTVMVNRLEFGQGVHTSLPMLIAEDLDCDWSQVRGELAPAADVYKDPAFGMQMTGGSGSIAHSYVQYREIGARARAMLIARRGRPMEGQAGAVHHVERPRDGTGRPEGQLRFARRRRHEAADATNRGAQGCEEFPHHRQTDPPHRRARQVERQAAVRHRLHAAQHEDRGGGAPAGVRRQGRQTRCQQGESHQGRDRRGGNRDRSRRTRRRRHRRRLLAGQAGTRCAGDRMGYRQRRKNQQRETDGRFCRAGENAGRSRHQGRHLATGRRTEENLGGV